mmetsp:Transcript_44345/g.102430  ORF Transcript_44345/g.102430 Transcript_44345/m.102430 type:complete len:1085 (+) Transcript_44345:54-3308(+)
MSQLTVSESAVLGRGGGADAGQLDKLLRGQVRLESHIMDVQHAVYNVQELVKQVLTVTPFSHKDSSVIGARASLPTRQMWSDAGRQGGSNSGLQVQPPWSDSACRGMSSSSLHWPQNDGGGVSPSPALMTLVSNGTHPSEFHSLGRTGTTAPMRHTTTSAGILAPHVNFQELAIAMRRTHYAQVQNLLDSQFSRGGSMHRTSTRFHPVSVSVAGSTRLPLHPMSFARISFDIFTVFMLMLDSILVPYFLAWDVSGQGEWAYYLTSTVTAFWTLDIVLNFCTAYIDGGNLIISWRAILVRYLRGGFLLDCAILAIDYADLVSFGRGPGSLQIIRLLRFAKVTRLVRVIVKLRCGLLARLDAMFTYRLQLYGLTSYANSIYFGLVLVKLLFLIVWLCHAGSCTWYFLQQRVVPSSEPSWLQALDDETQGTQSFYLHGLYWTVSAMFSGSSYLPPSNNVEAIASVTCITFSALFVTSITSNLAAKLIESQEAQQEMKKKLRALNAFMDQRGTPPLLAIAVRENFLHQMSAPAHLTELDIPQLAVLNKELRAHLRHYQYQQGFLQLGVFCILDTLDRYVLQDLCANGLTFFIVRAGNEVFGVNDLMQHAILFTRGSLHYTSSATSQQLSVTKSSGSFHGYRDARDAVGGTQSILGAESEVLPMSKFQPATMEQQTWVCELALFVHWSTRGTLKAERSCEMVQLAADVFVKVVGASPLMAAYASTYSLHIAELLRAKDDQQMVTDISTDIDDDHVTANMHSTLRELVSMPILEQLKNKHGPLATLMRRKSIHDLDVEIKTGKCFLVKAPAGNFTRVVRLVVLRLFNMKGMLCVKLAEQSGSTFHTRFQLPGRKIEGDDTHEETMKKWLDGELRPLARAIRLEEETETVMGFDQSQSFDLPTKYIKTIQKAFLVGNIEFHEDALDKNISELSHSNTLSSVPSSIKTLLSNVLSTSGDNPTFALLREETGPTESANMMKWSLSPANMRGGDSKGFGHPMTAVYKWMDPSDFTVLAGNSQDAHQVLGPRLSALTSKSKLQKLHKWHVAHAVEPLPEDWADCTSVTHSDAHQSDLLIGPNSSVLEIDLKISSI